MCHKISYRIEQVCKSMGIPYKSKHLETIDFHTDAIKLNDLYCQIKQIVTEIVEIADKHGSEDIANMLWHDIHMLEQTDHNIVTIAKLIDNRGK